MGRILAIDYGRKRVGLAVTDPLQIIASPLETVHSKDVIQYLKDYDKVENLEAIVLGMPMNLNNQPTDATLGAKQFENLLKKHFPEKPVYLQDERFTSKMAMDAMIAGGMKKKDRREKGNVDKISATIILQSFLESR
ncbi:crossover junction endodeoxyribonuclease RuvA [Roseivirga seohaensis]|uniref:Putative pre-16S rRNA nuclease n=2 Tax=Roseivirga seohaensis TaxID=1914963 RepID=A0A0L8AH37_9BACT|nr:Holliday junction resolvase RuvX [Roseivirga seohaensis]KOF01542.1 Holliday junction resolvase [Roseivirga seohaensis subsp. aquiponti]KYG85604.1 crossover junction endodeoxyribonuclease RuvA [Roseivirga seohaensis]|tara:strand:+ start:3639 stop:4049 length:411 start_codon:yes stop_codon:yes gene_type:complete